RATDRIPPETLPRSGSGEGGIRTRGTLAGTHDFQSCTFDHSVTSPWLYHGGESGIRTHGTLAGTPDFESGTFDHSVISPRRNMAAGQHAVNGSSALAEGCLGAGKRRARVGREWHLHQIPRAAIVPACVRFLSLLGA